MESQLSFLLVVRGRKSLLRKGKNDVDSEIENIRKWISNQK
jgi:hypothetical protein